MKLRFHPAATIELREAVQYYKEKSLLLALEFLGEFRRTIQKIRENPHVWSRSAKRTRRRNLRRFPYSVIYQIRNDELHVICVAHLSRRPNYWRDRL